ncbi:CDP-alcohol phosphatidyltransferase family protein [soil metagenome]
MLKKDLFNISNLLSILRVILLFPVCYLIIYEFDDRNTLIISILILMYITDLLDGFLARKLNQVTESGKVLDPLADKISMVVIATILAATGRIPLWFYIVIVLRDLVILAGGIYLKNKRNITLMSNIPGKLAVFSIGLVILFTIFNTELLRSINSYLILVSLILIIYSSYIYFIRFYKTIGEKNGK